MQKTSNLFPLIGRVALGTLAILAIPLVAMQFNTEMQWGPADFIIMGMLIFGTGLLLVLTFTLGREKHIAYKIGWVITVGATFAMIGLNLAVGLIGAGPNPGNFLYLGVMGVLILGVYWSGLRAARLETAVIATAIALLLVIAIALLTGMHHYPESSVLEIVGVNLFLAVPYLLAGGFFSYAAHREIKPTL